MATDEKSAPELVFTFNELGAAMLRVIEGAMAEEGYSDAARDFALSRTALEDALTRYNSGRYRQKGTWHRADPDAD